MTAVLAATVHRKVLKQIFVGELRPDDTVDAVREARLLAKVTLGEAGTASYMGPMLRMSLAYSITYVHHCTCMHRLTGCSGLPRSGLH